jgi:type VI secretion system secreted protein Hcp
MATVGFGNPMLGAQIGNNGAPKDSLQEMFAELSSTPGSSTDSKHSKWMDISSCGFAVSQSTSAHTGGGSGVGRANFEEFYIMKFVDRATPNLMKHCASGKHLDQLVVSICKVGGSQQEYMKITLKGVFITSVTSVSNTESPRMMERVGFSFETIMIDYKDQNPDGSLGASVTGAWDVKQNKAA